MNTSVVIATGEGVLKSIDANLIKNRDAGQILGKKPTNMYGCGKKESN